MDPETAPVEPAEPAAPAESTSPPEGEPAPKGEPEDKRLKDARNEAKNLRERAKAAEAELSEIKAAQMTEAEKAEARLRAAEEQVPTLLKRAVAAESGLPPELAGRLVGETEEDLKADADALKALIGTKEPAPEGEPAKGWPNAPQGPRGNPKPTSLQDRVAALEAEGKYAEAAPLKAQMAAQHVAGS